MLRHRQRRSWERGARRLGLVLAPDGGARGVYRGHRIDAEWRGPDLSVALHGPSLVDPRRAADVHARLGAALAFGRERKVDPRLRWAAASDVVARAALLAVRDLERTGDAVLVLRLRADGRVERDRIAGAVDSLVWIAEQLGWAPSDPAATALRTGIEDPDPQVRLRAWEQLLGGWVPTGFAASDRRETARAAASNPDRWIATLGALHLGEDGLEALRATVLDPSAPDDLVARALRGVWDDLPPSALVGLLDRAGEEIVVRACQGLGRVGTAAEIPELRRVREKTKRKAAEAAIAAIVERIGGAAGQVGLADDPSGGVSLGKRR